MFFRLLQTILYWPQHKKKLALASGCSLHVAIRALRTVLSPRRPRLFGGQCETCHDQLTSDCGYSCSMAYACQQATELTWLSTLFFPFFFCCRLSALYIVVHVAIIVVVRLLLPGRRSREFFPFFRARAASCSACCDTWATGSSPCTAMGICVFDHGPVRHNKRWAKYNAT